MSPRPAVQRTSPIQRVTNKRRSRERTANPTSGHFPVPVRPFWESRPVEARPITAIRPAFLPTANRNAIATAPVIFSLLHDFGRAHRASQGLDLPMTLPFRRRFAPRCAAVLLALVVAAPAGLLAAAASDAVNLEVMTQIRQEGFHNSKVMEIEGQLTDVMGPRLTGSPNMKRANEWTRDQFTGWGLVNSHLESFNFGRGWSNEYTEVRMVAPQASPLLAYPNAWTVSTNGALRAAVLKAKLATQADLDKYKGQLAGKIVLNGDMREGKPGEKPALKR